MKFNYNNLVELNDIFSNDLSACSVNESNSIDENSQFYRKIFVGIVLVLVIGFLYYNFNGGSGSNIFQEEILSDSENLVDSSMGISETVYNSFINNDYTKEKLTQELNNWLYNRVCDESGDIEFMMKVPEIMDQSNQFIASGVWEGMSNSDIKAAIITIINDLHRNFWE